MNKDKTYLTKGVLKRVIYGFAQVLKTSSM